MTSTIEPPVRRPVRWWVLQLPDPLRAAALAPGFEADGWDGITYGDNQCRVGDVVITLTLAAQATERVHLGTGVTNAVTRHPTILASAWANLQELSNGRMMLGLARGDSALADIGLAMQPVAKFEKVVRQLRALLAGDAVAFEQAEGPDGVPAVESLKYAKSHAASRIEWMDPSVPRVPLDLTVSGPRTIALAARHADRVTFSVGADPERLRWGVQLARSEAAAAGRDPDGISYGAYIQVICNPDRKYATDLGKSVVALHARLAGLHGKGTASGPFSKEDRRVVEALSSQYDMTLQGKGGSQVELISDDFAQRFAVYGPPDECIPRLQSVIDAGIDRIVINAPLRVGTPLERRENLRRISSDVIPALREVPAAS